MEFEALFIKVHIYSNEEFLQSKGHLMWLCWNTTVLQTGGIPFCRVLGGDMEDDTHIHRSCLLAPLCLKSYILLMLWCPPSSRLVLSFRETWMGHMESVLSHQQGFLSGQLLFRLPSNVKENLCKAMGLDWAWTLSPTSQASIEFNHNHWVLTVRQTI